MGSITPSGVSGTGEASTGVGGVTVIEVYAILVTPGNLTHFVGGSGLERVFQAGWFGVGFTVGGPYTVRTIVWGKFLNHLAEDHFFDTADKVYADTLFWDLDPGVELDLQMWWP